MKLLRLLFIGNSHTYCNDMPLYVRAMARECGFDCEVTMLAHGGWYLEQHANEPDVRFNILYGKYDYVILQEHSHPFAPEDKYRSAVIKLNEWIKEAGAKTVIYETWAKKDEPEKQAEMNRVQALVADEIGAILAPVGENWQAYRKSWPDVEMYAEDGAHASPRGSEFAAKMIWEGIREDLRRSE